MPNSSRLVKKSMEIKPFAKPLISRERVDRALETLKKSSKSPKVTTRTNLRLANTKISRSESLNPPPTQKLETPDKSGPQSLPIKEMAEKKREETDEEMSSETYCSKQTELKETPQFKHSVVVAIDFGTTFSGYAYSFTHEPENIHIMRKWEGNFLLLLLIYCIRFMLFTFCCNLFLFCPKILCVFASQFSADVCL